MRKLALMLLLSLSIACDGGDIGSECVGMDVPDDATGTEGSVERSESPSIVEYDVSFPCASSACIAASRYRV